MKKTALIIFIALALLVSTTTVWANNPVLLVGTDAAFVPFEYVDDNNQIVGFDVDLMNAIGAIIGREVRFMNVNWDGLLTGLQNRNFDVIAAGMTITEERAQQVNFSDPYFESVLTIVVHQNNTDIKVLEDLVGKIVSVQINTTGDFVASDIEGMRDRDIRRFNTAPDALQNIVIGATHAAIIDLPVAEAFMAQNPNAPLKHLGALIGDDFFGLALRKQDTELLTQINQALAQIKADGTYDEIFKKWFATN